MNHLRNVLTPKCLWSTTHNPLQYCFQSAFYFNTMFSPDAVMSYLLNKVQKLCVSFWHHWNINPLWKILCCFFFNRVWILNYFIIVGHNGVMTLNLKAEAMLQYFKIISKEPEEQLFKYTNVYTHDSHIQCIAVFTIHCLFVLKHMEHNIQFIYSSSYRGGLSVELCSSEEKILANMPKVIIKKGKISGCSLFVCFFYQSLYQ